MGLTEKIIEQPHVYRLWQAPFAERKFRPILRHNDVSSISHVVDVGAGPGTNARHFPDAGYLGIDISPEYVEYATRRYGKEFVVADATEYVPDNGRRADFVLINSFLHHVDDGGVGRVMSNMRRLVSSDGCLHVLELVLPARPSIADLLARWDRGDYARSLDHWRALFTEHFEPLVFEPYPLGLGPATLWHMVYFKGRARS